MVITIAATTIPATTITAGTVTVITITAIGIGEADPENLLDAEDRHEYYGSGDGPRDYSPNRDRPGSPPLYAAQRVLPISFGFVVKAACAF